MRTEGKGDRNHRGRKQSALASPTLWNLVFDENLETVLKGGNGNARASVCSLSKATGHRRRRPKSVAERAEYANHLAYVDDILLIGKSAEEICTMYRESPEACEKKGLTVQEDKLCLWSTNPDEARHAPVRHRATEAWAKSWLTSPALKTRALWLHSRLKRWMAEVFPVVAWGCTAWHFREARPGSRNRR